MCVSVVISRQAGSVNDVQSIPAHRTEAKFSTTVFW